MWVRENRTKRSDCGFSNPEGANSARSVNHLLNEGKTYYEAASMDAGGVLFYSIFVNIISYSIILHSELEINSNIYSKTSSSSPIGKFSIISTPIP